MVEADTYRLHLNVIKAGINLVLWQETVIEKEFIGCILLLTHACHIVSEFSSHS